jgi:hypothetical protein
MKRMMGIVMSFGLVLAVAACDKKEEAATTTTTTTETKATADTAAKPADRPADTTATAPAAGGDVGVAECDEYIAKMTECAGKMAPEASGPMKESMDTMRKAWKDASSTPEGKQALASGCKQALDAAKSAYASMGCTF